MFGSYSLASTILTSIEISIFTDRDKAVGADPGPLVTTRPPHRIYSMYSIARLAFLNHNFSALVHP